MKTTHFAAVGFALVMALATNGRIAAAEPDSLEQVFRTASAQWQAEDWVPKSGVRTRFMRPPDNAGWQARMKALQAIVGAGSDGVEMARRYLREGDLAQRALAAQALGFMPAKDARADLLEAAREDSEDVVRLYAIDSLGMLGGDGFPVDWKALAEAQKNRDVKRHLAYATQRAGAPVSPEVVAQLLNWDPAQIDTARIGQLAPDFELGALAGEKVRLSDYRGQKAVVLVFIYGDT